MEALRPRRKTRATWPSLCIWPKAVLWTLPTCSPPKAKTTFLDSANSGKSKVFSFGFCSCRIFMAVKTGKPQLIEFVKANFAVGEFCFFSFLLNNFFLQGSPISFPRCCIQRFGIEFFLPCLKMFRSRLVRRKTEKKRECLIFF